MAVNFRHGDVSRPQFQGLQRQNLKPALRRNDELLLSSRFARNDKVGGTSSDVQP